MPEQPERHPRRFGRFEEHGEVIPSGPVRPLAPWTDIWYRPTEDPAGPVTSKESDDV